MVSSIERENRAFVFGRVPHWANYFGDIREHRNHLRTALDALVTEGVHKQLRSHRSPIVSVHVRRGDFRKLRPGEDFAKVGLVQTDLKYFISMIRGIRNIAGEHIPITVFSDGTNDELREILSLRGIVRQPPGPAIVDLLLMSRSSVIVASAGSTFSYWAGFLSNAALILHPDHVHAPIRCAADNDGLFEGGVSGRLDEWPLLLRRNLTEIDLYRKNIPI